LKDGFPKLEGFAPTGKPLKMKREKEFVEDEKKTWAK